MSNGQPLVSVLITAYNRQNYIAEAIESVLASTYTNFELIIVDDCSTDNTVKIAQEFEKSDRRVSVIVNEKNLGDYPNRNNAASYAKGVYIKYVDSDDTILPFGLQYCVDNMEQHQSSVLGMYFPYEIEPNNTNCWMPEKIVKEHFFNKQALSIGPTGTIIRRKEFLENGGFDTRFGVASDMFFNIKTASYSSVVLLPKLFVGYRLHEGQEKNDNLGYLVNGYLYFKELCKNVDLPLTKKEVEYLFKKLQKRHAVNLIKYFIKTKSISKTNKVIQKTAFSWLKMITSLFN